MAHVISFNNLKNVEQCEDIIKIKYRPVQSCVGEEGGNHTLMKSLLCLAISFSYFKPRSHTLIIKPHLKLKKMLLWLSPASLKKICILHSH